MAIDFGNKESATWPRWMSTAIAAKSAAQPARYVVELQSWLAAIGSDGLRDAWDPKRSHPAPPTGLTPEDFADAGFEFLGGRTGRRGADVCFQVSLSRDLRHQAIFAQASRGPGGALLWIDGQQVPVPVDVEGNPKSDAVLRWLAQRFSQGSLAGVNPVRALSLWTWMTEAARTVLHGPHSFEHTFPAPPNDLTPPDCEAVGFGFDATHSAQSFLDEGGSSRVRVEFSPGLRHQAVLVKGPDWSGALLWMDGEIVPVPREADGDPMCAHALQWLDERFAYAEVGGLWSHPLLDPNKLDPLGEIRGLLIWDAFRCMRQIELPQVDQVWTAPILVARDETWRIYPDGEAFCDDRADRVLPIPR